MRAAKILAVLGVIAVASGCAHQESPTGTVTPGTSQGKGLEINSFRVADTTLTPGQKTVVVLNLQNYHRRDINITEISLYNLGIMDAEKIGCTPQQIDRAKNGLRPRMKCKWRLSAPSAETVGGFERRSLSFNLHLEYRSSLVNREPLEIQFKPLKQLNSTSQVSRTFANGEVRATMTTESPASFEGRTVNFKVKEIGKGRTVSNYTFSYSPDIFHGCPEEDRPVVGEKFEFSCTVKDSEEVVRNLFFSTRYKYVKEPTVDVTLVRPQ
ncbi:MAG: hypothetical protein ABEJ98_00050 [Candidatus Nanohaloarchaea archaeon]